MSSLSPEVHSLSVRAQRVNSLCLGLVPVVYDTGGEWRGGRDVGRHCGWLRESSVTKKEAVRPQGKEDPPQEYESMRMD